MRAELDALAEALSDPRFEFASPWVLRCYLHAAAGVEPTPEEVADFVDTNLPRARHDVHPTFVLDSRIFFRWVNPVAAAVVERVGGVPADMATAMAHGWTLAREGMTRLERMAVEKLVAQTPEVFRLSVERVVALGDRVPLRPIHITEAIVDPALGVNGVFGVGADGEVPDSVVEVLALQLLRLRMLWPDFRSSRWFAPIDARLSCFPAYQRALELATVPPERPPGLHPLVYTSGTVTTPAGRALFVYGEHVFDRRLGVGRLSPLTASATEIWPELT